MIFRLPFTSMPEGKAATGIRIRCWLHWKGESTLGRAGTWANGGVAGEHEIQLAVHQQARGKSRYWHPESVLAALEGREHFGACADLGHWVRSGLDPVESMKKLEGRIISVHAKDLDEFGNLEARDVRIGSGVIDYKTVIEELERQSFSGPVYIEAEHDWEDNLESVRTGVEYLRQLRDGQTK